MQLFTLDSLVYGATEFGFFPNVIYSDVLMLINSGCSDVLKTYDRKILPSEYGEKVTVSTTVHITTDVHPRFSEGMDPNFRKGGNQYKTKKKRI